MGFTLQTCKMIIFSWRGLVHLCSFLACLAHKLLVALCTHSLFVPFFEIYSIMICRVEIDSNSNKTALVK